jgi:hypothetical protein
LGTRHLCRIESAKDSIVSTRSRPRSRAAAQAKHQGAFQMTKRSKGTGMDASSKGLTRRKLLLAAGGRPRDRELESSESRASGRAAERAGGRRRRPDRGVAWRPGRRRGRIPENLHQKTGVQTVQQRLLPGAAVPKLEAEFRTGNRRCRHLYDVGRRDHGNAAAAKPAGPLCAEGHRRLRQELSQRRAGLVDYVLHQCRPR